ncbi:LppU/SCO3897 family protein [Actinophytocola sp.]|uniref:LppU/SCO3897 family protein n=1 Tax=Actinophytocola sp. TaxID=1872138 RepID=UPI003D6B0F37
MNNYPPPGPPQGPPGGPYGRPGPYGPPGRPPRTPPGGGPYGPPPYGPPGGRPGYGGGPGWPGGPGGPRPGGPGHGGPGGPGPGGPGGPDPYGDPPPHTPPGGQPVGTPPGGFARTASPPPPAPKKGNAKIARIVASLVVAVVVAGVVIWLQREEQASAAVGDCIKVVDVAKADIEQVDCGDKAALYKVAITKDDVKATCPNQNYLAYTETGRGDLLLCLTLNAKEGECFKSDGQVQVRADCASGAEYQITKVIEGSADPQRCGPANVANAITYPQPKLTLCRETPKGTAS